MEIQTYVGSEIADFTSGEKPPENAEFIGEFDFGSSPAGGDIRQYWISLENQIATLWDSFVDGDINGGMRLFARIASCDFESKDETVALASSLLMSAIEAEIELYGSDIGSAKCTEAGLLDDQQLSNLINRLRR